MFYIWILGICTLLYAPLRAEGDEAPPIPQEEVKETPLSAEEIATISEAFGHVIGKSMDHIGFQLDIDKVVQGIQDAAHGKEPPMSEAECVQAISQAQQAAFRAQSSKNLEEANRFLEEHSKESGVCTLVDRKLLYTILQKGEGQAVQEHDTPLIRYSGKYLDGTSFVSSQNEEQIVLDEMIPGFAKGLVGMQEGERRQLVIHPELAYQTSGYLQPNALLIFEVELVKANVAQETASFSAKREQEEQIGEGSEPLEVR